MTLQSALKKYKFAARDTWVDKCISYNGVVIGFNDCDNLDISVSDLVSDTWEFYHPNFRNMKDFKKPLGMDICIINNNLLLNSTKPLLDEPFIKKNRFINGLFFSKDYKSIITDASFMFFDYRNLVDIDTSPFSNIVDASTMFGACGNLISIDTYPFKKIHFANDMFNGCTKLTAIDTTSFKTITNADGMFRNCKSLSIIDTSNFKNVINANEMFSSCKELTSFNSKGMSKVKESKDMFSGCDNLKSADLSDMVNIEDSTRMFFECKSLEYVKLPKNFYISHHAFFNCNNLKKVDFLGTKYNWNYSIGALNTGNDILRNVKVVCTDGEIH